MRATGCGAGVSGYSMGGNLAVPSREFVSAQFSERSRSFSARSRAISLSSNLT